MTVKISLDSIAKVLNYFLKFVNAELIKKTNLETLRGYESFKNDLLFLKALCTPPNSSTSFASSERLLNLLDHSRGQLRQDLFVLAVTDFKLNGTFVEIGVGDGFYLSNTFLLEDRFNWSGILAEPAKIFHESIRKRIAVLETRAIYSASDVTLEFLEDISPELSTLYSFKDSDFHLRKMTKGGKYDVQTLTLNELLVKHRLPFHIDYLSIDTEGSEFEIIKNFDFTQHQFKVITIEHNYDIEKRDNIYKLLSRQGYRRVYESVSKFDDWYIFGLSNKEFLV
jgi:FkbM family methyltransferase